MTFGDIIGQKTVVNSLKNSIKNDMVGHAYIFEGPQGIGKKTIASIFAAALVCLDEQGVGPKKGEPCASCRNCLKVQHGNHPDIKVIDSETSSGGSSSIGIDTIRELQKDIFIKPYESNKKIYIISRAERMTIQAQNSLLKILEEPPGYAVIILTVENAVQLLETILSRAVLMKFRLHPKQEIEAFLAKNYPNSSHEIPVLAAFSDGVIGKAKELAVSEEFRNMRQEVVNIIMKLLDSDELQVLNTVDYFLDHKHMIEQILDILLSWFRDILFIKELYADDKIMNMDLKNKLQEFAGHVRTGSVVKMMDNILEIRRKIKINANYVLAIETMLMKSWEEIHGKRSRSAV